MFHPVRLYSYMYKRCLMLLLSAACIAASSMLQGVSQQPERVSKGRGS